MVQVSRRTGFTGSALIGLLVRLTDGDVPESKRSFSDRLSQWLGWTDAISLSSVLNSSPGSPASALPDASAAGSAEERECARVRAALAKAIAEDGAAMAEAETDGGPSPAADAAAIAPPAFSLYRRRYLTRQQAMETAIAPLRARLRSALSARSPAMAQLAAVDAVMEQALSAHEHRVLGGVPVLLEKRFKRLRQAAEADRAEGNDRSAAWLTAFGQDVHSVLLAELDIRFQPVEGLLEALRMK